MISLLCFSHLGWNFVYQRPQHLLSRFTSKYKLYYFEEPKPAEREAVLTEEKDGVVIVTLFYAENKGFDAGNIASLLDNFLAERNIDSYGIWYYTPMAVEYTSHLVPQFTVYDSMDELSKFRFAPPQLKELEEELFRIADVVFTGGHSLYEAKKHRNRGL